MIDRRMLVLIGAYAAGILCQSLPMTLAGTVCSGCIGFFVGVVGRQLLDRWSDE